ncbi:MAG TPA: SDR family oxidoreductase [Ktedonobacterales bacterium]|nr:SDR family oxidoreductase [Ktedonobacterales bacterium]
MMSLGLEGKTALVTGASRGIGRAIAHALHAEGVGLALVARSQQGLQDTLRSLQSVGGSPEASATRATQKTAGAPVHLLTADLALASEIERVAHEAIAQLGHVDILINNAAQARNGLFFEMSDAELQTVWQVKGIGYVRMVRAIVPHMREHGGGRILNIAGDTARTPRADFIVGSMVNAALVNFTRGIARELAGYNIRVNAISPGWTLTENLQRSFELRANAQGITVDELMQREARGLPLKRLVTMEEIAALAAFVVSDRCPALTGEDIAIDSGATPGV